MDKTDKKMGFLNSFMAHNVNIASPETNVKWENMLQYLKEHSSDLINQYEQSSQVKEFVDISCNVDMPDKLFEFSKTLLKLVNFSPDKAKNDHVIITLIEKLVDVAKSSCDGRIIDYATKIIKQINSIK